MQVSRKLGSPQIAQKVWYRGDFEGLTYHPDSDDNWAACKIYDPIDEDLERKGMIFTETPLAGAYLVELERRGDDRGFFARAFCTREFAAQGLATEFVQANMSQSRDPGTLRGMHFQRAPAQETKLVRCVAGALYDVIVDNRPDSSTYLQSFGAELTAENGLAIYVPKGFAHGFQTLAPHTMASYMVDEYYTPEAEGGYRHDDPALGIDWPAKVTVISTKDASWPLILEGREA
jgi:dTDP-4-dehydrorhamnose 3,5-epimerase